MWKYKKIITLGVGIGTSLLAFKKIGIIGNVEAGGKAPFPQQPHCVGRGCPKVAWDDDWDKKEGQEALVRTIVIITHGQADKTNGSKKAPSVQKVAHKSKEIEVNRLPSDPRRFLKPQNVANTDGDSNVDGLSQLGANQVKSFLKFFLEEFGGTELRLMVHGTDPASVATAKMVVSNMEKDRGYSYVETSMLDPLSPTVAGEDEPNPGDSARLEAVFRKYFYRLPDDGAMGGTIDVIVCSPKLVGYFINRILQVSPQHFTNWNLPHASFTEIVVYRNGRIGIHRAGDIGYMPPKDVTYE